MRKYIWILVIALISQAVMGQSSTIATGLSYPSVNNSFLGKPDMPSANGPLPLVGVDYYTGSAQVSVPICQLASKQLTIPITVDYVDGRGVKLQEYASQVGLGWQLNAGGSISRVVRGFPDEMPNGYLGTGSSPSVFGVRTLQSAARWGLLATSTAQSPITTISAEQRCFLGHDQFNVPSTPTADGEPDLFYVKTPFFNFKFVFNASGQPVFLNKTGYQIITTNFFNTAPPACNNPSFEVIDDQGNQFYFGSTTASTEQSTDSIYNQNLSFISTWYLDKIVTFNSRDVITLTYQAALLNEINYQYSWMELTPGATTITNTGKTTIATPKYVSVISSSLGEADFSYQTGRLDDPNAYILSSIVLKAYNAQTASNSTTLQTYTFVHSYFGPAFSTDLNLLRLRLDGIKMTGNTSGTSTPLTIAGFGYNETIDLPNRTLPLADYWGFCNATSNTMDIASRNYQANPATVQADILTTVTNMEGGSWQISYEPNDYGSPPVDGVRVNQITQASQAGSFTKTYTYPQIALGVGSGQVMAATYTLLTFQIGNGFVSFSGSPFVYNDLNGISLGYSYVKETNPDGGATFYSFTNFNDVADQVGIGFNDAQVVQWSSGSNPFPQGIASDDLSEKRGLLTKVSVVNANGDHVAETAYTYAPVNTQAQVTKDAYGIRGFTVSMGGNSSTTNVIYYTPTENYRLQKTVRTDYDQASPSGTPMVTTTNFTYDPSNNRQVYQITTIDSKGQNHIQTYYHADDVANTSPNPVIPLLTTAEITPVVHLVAGNYTGAIIHSIDSRNNTKTEVHNTYADFSGGSVTHQYPASRTTYASDPVNTTSTITRQAFYNFDVASSDLLSSNGLGDKSVSAQYLYNASLPVAMVSNAASNEFFYQGFEETVGNVTTSAHTGNRSFSGSYTIPFTVPNGRSYLLQYWSYNGTAWVFNQRAFTGTIILTGQIDDVRVFPRDALMTTSTYNPLVGKTSETDPSGRSVFSQYDGLNRLQTILDQDGNILKQYDYKYQILPSTGSNGLVLTGIPGYSSGGPTTGQGTISGAPGYVITVTMHAAGSPGAPCGLNVMINGAPSNGPTSVTNGTLSFTFVMPLSGTVSWFASLVPTGPGGGSFSIQY